MLFRRQSTKLHFVVPRGTPNDASVKYVSSWFPDFLSEGVFTISYAVPHLCSTVTPPWGGGVTTILGGHLLVVTSPKISGRVTGDLPQNLVWGGGSPKFGDLPQKSGWGGSPFGSDLPHECFGGGSPFACPGEYGARWDMGISYKIANFSSLAPSALAESLPSVGKKRTKNEPFVRKRSWRILSVKGRASVKLALSVSQNVRILTSICTVERHSPRSTKLSPAAKKMACLDSPHVKIRRTPEDIHAQARNFAKRTTDGSRMFNSQ